MMFSRLSAISQNISHTFQVVLIDVPCLACIVAQREGEGEGAKRCGRREEGGREGSGCNKDPHCWIFVAEHPFGLQSWNLAGLLILRCSFS